MKLAKISIQNFKSIKKGSFDCRSNKTIIIGRNNTGKTNLLQILGLVLKLGSRGVDLPSFNLEFNDKEYYFDISKPIVVNIVFEFGFDEKIPVEIEQYVEKIVGKKIVRIKLTKHMNQDGDFIIGDNTVRYPEFVKTARFIHLNCIFLSVSRGYKKEMGKDVYSIYMSVLANVIKSFIDNNKDNILSNRLLPEDEFDEKLLYDFQTFFNQEIFIGEAINNLEHICFKQKRSLKSSIILALDTKSKISIDEAFDLTKNLHVVVNDGKAQELSLKGMGVQSLLLINLVLKANGFFELNPILCIDEAELHLHPQAQRRFNEILDRLSKDNQIIMTTHSPIMVNACDINDLVLLKKADSTKFVQLPEKKFIDENDLERELNEFNTEMLFANSVILVEGITEKILFRHIANNCMESNFNLNSNNISVIPVGGKSGMSFYCNILQRFEIPYLVVLDKGQESLKICRKIMRERKLAYSNFEDKLIEELKINNIFYLKKGEIEDYYPTRIIESAKKAYKLDVEHKIMKEKLDLSNQTFKIFEEAINKNLDFFKKYTGEQLHKKEIKRLYDRTLVDMNRNGLLLGKEKRTSDILYKIFGRIGKPRIAIEICKQIKNSSEIDPLIVDIIKKAVDISLATNIKNFLKGETS